MGLKLETKTTAALDAVSHDTLKASSGGLLLGLKAEYKPRPKLFGRQLQFTLTGTEQTVLKPKKYPGVTAAAKISLSRNVSVTGKYGLDKKKWNVSAKVDQTVMNRLLKTEFKYEPKGKLGVEAEYFLSPNNKFQVETLGKQVEACKLTHINGRHELKAKYIIPGKQPVLGYDTRYGNQKYDLEYNIATGAFEGKLKVYPMQLAVKTTVKKGVFKPLSYKITAEREWYI